MDTSHLDFNSIKMQLKARLRVPMLMQSKRLNLEFSKYFNSPQLNEINMISYTQSRIKMNKSYLDSFNKFTLKTNLIRRVLSNMEIKDIYEEEKDCSKKCNEVINNINLKNRALAPLNLPLLNNNINSKKRRINLKRIKIQPTPIKPLIFKRFKSEMQNTPVLSTTNRNSTYLESTREKSRGPLTSRRKSKKELSSKNSFKFNESFVIIKGGGIKYNNSMYRFKNMNDFLHFKI